MMPTPEDRWRWVQAALVLLRDDGLRLNPQSAELYRELAWLFELKMGVNIDSAAATFREKWRALASDVAARDAWEELRMDRTTMARMERHLGKMDRTNPLYSAMYWAYAGLPHATGTDREVLKGILQQSKMVYDRACAEIPND